MEKQNNPEFIYKVIASSSGVRVFKSKIGSITKKNVIYQNGMNQKRISLDELNTYIVSEVSTYILQNPVYIHTLDDLENNKELLIKLSNECLEIYKTKILEEMNKYKEVIESVSKINVSETLPNINYIDYK